MDGPDLTTELRNRAEATAAAIRESARLEAKELKMQAERQIENRRFVSLREEEERYRAAARSRIAEERRAAMGSMLLAKTRIVDRVLEKATSLLPSASQTEAYRSTIGRQIAECLHFVTDGGAVVRCAPALVPILEETVRSYESVIVEPDAEIHSGFVVVSTDGSVAVDKRLDARLQRLKTALAIEIHDNLEKM